MYISLHANDSCVGLVLVIQKGVVLPPKDLNCLLDVRRLVGFITRKSAKVDCVKAPILLDLDFRPVAVLITEDFERPLHGTRPVLRYEAGMVVVLAHG